MKHNFNILLLALLLLPSLLLFAQNETGENTRLLQFYESMGPDYPGQIPDGWHKVSLVDADGSIIPDQLVEVVNNRIVSYRYMSRAYQDYLAPVTSPKIVEGKAFFQDGENIYEAFFLAYLANPEIRAKAPVVNPLGSWWDHLDEKWKILLSNQEFTKIDRTTYRYYYGYATINHSRVHISLENPRIIDLQNIALIDGIYFGSHFEWDPGYTREVMMKLPELKELKLDTDLLNTKAILTNIPFPNKIKKLKCAPDHLSSLSGFENLEELEIYGKVYNETSLFAGKEILYGLKELGEMKKLKRLTIIEDGLYNKLNAKRHNVKEKDKQEFVQEFRQMFPACKEIRYGVRKGAPQEVWVLDN